MTTILYIEYNTTDVRLISEMLKERCLSEYDLQTAGTLKEGCEKIRNNGIGIILLDLNLPDSNGKENFQKVKECAGNIPVVLLSGAEDEELSLQLIREGAQDYIAKNFLNTALLLKTIQYSIERKKTEKELYISEEKFRNLVETTHDIIWQTNMDGVFTYVSPQVENILGYKQDVMIGHSPFEFMQEEEAKKIKERSSDIIKSKKPYEGLININLHKDGHEVYFETSGVPVFDKKNNLIGYRGIDRDITERELDDMKLLESEKNFRAIFESTGTATLLVEGDQTIIMANDECLLLTGYTSQELIGQKWTNYVATESLQIMIENHNLRRKGPTAAPKKYEVKLVDKKGGIRIAILDIEMMPGTKQSIVSILDITERKQAEDALRESESKFHAIFDSHSAAIAIIDSDTTISMVNEAYCKLSGYTREEVIGMSWTKQIPPDDLERLKEYNRIRLENPNEAPKDYEFSFYHKNGEIRHAMMSVGIIENGKKIIASFIDITERILAEEKIQDLAKFPEENTNPVYRISKEGVLLYCNPAGREVTPIHFLKIGKKLSAQWCKRIKEIYDSGKRCREEIRFNRKVFSFEEVPLIEGEYVNLYGTDITDRKKAERIIQESEEKYSKAFMTSPYAITITSTEDGKFIEVNDAYTAIAGFTREEALADSSIAMNLWVNIEDRKWVVKELTEGREVAGKEFHFKKKNGEFITGLFSAQILHLNDKPYIISSINDITERKLADIALIESENKYRMIAENTADLIWSMDMNFKFTFLSPSIFKIRGYTVEEGMTQTLDQVLTPDSLQRVFVIFEKQMTLFQNSSREESPSVMLELEHYNKDGDIIHTENTVSLLLNEKKQAIGILGITRDISERKKAEETLQLSEKKLREAQEMAHLGFWLWDIKTGNVEWSDEVYKIFCLDANSFTPQIDSIQKLSPWSGEHERDKELINRAIETHSPGSYEQKFLRPDNSIGYYFSTFQGNFDEKDNLISIVGTVLDITERKLAEELNKKHLEEQKLLSEVASKLVSLENMDEIYNYIGNIIFGLVNDSYVFLTSYITERKSVKITHTLGAGKFLKIMQTRFGIDPFGIEVPILEIPVDELKIYKNRSLVELPDGLYTLSAGKVKKVICKAIEKMLGIKKVAFMGFTWEDKLYGGVAILQKNNAPLKNKDLIETIINQTAVAIQRKHAEDKLLQNEKLYRSLVETSPDGICMSDLNGRLITANQKALEFFGYPLSVDFETVTKNIIDYIVPCDKERAIENATKKMKGEYLSSQEYMALHNNGTEFPIEINSSVIFDVHDKPYAMISVIRDITERKQAEKLLAESEERFRSLFENATIGIYRTTPEGHILLANPSLVRMLGYEFFDELAGRDLNVEGYGQGYERSYFHNLIKSKGEIIGLESCWERKDGRLIFVNESVKLIRDNDGKILYYEGTVEDITIRKQSEKALIKSEEKFRSIFENVQDVYYDVDFNGTIIEVSPSIETLTRGQIKREFLIGKPMYEFYADRNERIKLLKTIKEKGSVSDYELKLKNLDGSEIYCSITSKILFDENNKPLRIIGTMRDIDARKRAEEALAESEKKYRVIAEKTTDVIWLMDLEGKSIFVTPSIEKFTGFTVEEYLKQTIEERFTPQSAEYGMGIFSRELQLCLSSTEYLGGFHTTLELEYNCKDGSTKWGELLITPFYDEQKKLIGIHGVTRDVTEHKLSKAKEKARIKNIEALAKVVLEIVELPFEADFFETITGRLYKLLPNSIVLVNSFDNAKMLFRTEAIRGLGSFAEKVFSIMGGHPEKETYLIDDETLSVLLTGKLERAGGGLYQLSMEQLPKAICQSIETILGIKNCYGIGLVYNKKLLGSVIILNKQRKLEVEKELIEIYMSQISIVLERRNAEKELRISEERFRELFTQANDVIFTIDLDGNFKTYNTAAAKIIGLGPHDNPEIINMRDLLSEKELKKVMAKMTEKLDGSIRHTFYEANIINLKGQKLDLELNSSVRFKDGKPFEIFAIGRDITERKQLGIQLKNNYENQYAISSILQLSHQDISLKDILLKAFDYIFEISWLPIEKRGGLFLATDDNTLELFIDLNLSKEILKTCKKIKFGECLCGKVALSKKIEFISQVNESHIVKYPGMHPHGHYCVPIIYSGKTIAVLNTYVPDGHSYNQEEADFLQLIANTLSGVIIRKQAEEKLKEVHAGLEEKIIKRTAELAKANEDLKDDIIRRRIAEEQLLNAQQLNLATINAINEWVYMVDRDMRLVMMNDNAVEALHEIGGIRAENYKGRRIDQVLKFISEKELKEYATVFETGKDIFTNETTAINDQLFITETKKIPIFENDVVVHVVTTVYNITKLKQAEQEISRALDKEKELGMVKSRFLNVITHEFRNPLTGILSSVQLLERFGSKWDVEKLSNTYQGIYGAIKYTNFLLDDVSLIGKDESGKLSFIPKKMNIENFSREICNEIQVIFGSNIPVELIVDSDLGEVNADPSLLRHILTNLLSNAIKYSREGGKVEFQIKEHTKNQVEFIIVDHGIGIPTTDMQYIAEPFHRASNVEKIKGTGLGLSIVKRCIEMHNGTFEINSQENVGTEIKVIIPFTR